MIDRDDITGLILAGGRGSRMGGVDKGLQAHLGMPLAMHALLRLSPQVGEMMINANRNLAAYESMGAPVWPDALPDYPGPLAGFLAGLEHCETPYLATVPCDSPHFPEDLVARLAERLDADDAEIAIAATREDGELRLQPVFCLMKHDGHGEPGPLHGRRPAQDRRLDRDLAPRRRRVRRCRARSSTPTPLPSCAGCSDDDARLRCRRSRRASSGYDPKALPVAQAQEFIARLVPRVQAVEKVALRSALGRVLAEDVVSAIAVPSHDNSAMDGYALRGSELADASGERVQGRRRRLRGRPVRGRRRRARVRSHHDRRGHAGRARHGRAAGVRSRRRRRRARAGGRRPPRRQPAPRRRGPGPRRDRARRRPPASPARPRPARFARQRRGGGLPPPARRLLLHRQRAALARRDARRRLRLRQQPLHDLGDAAAARRRGPRPRRRPRRAGRARRRLSRRRRCRRRGDHVGRRQRRRSRPHQGGDGRARRRRCSGASRCGRAGRWRSAGSRAAAAQRHPVRPARQPGRGDGDLLRARPRRAAGDERRDADAAPRRSRGERRADQEARRPHRVPARRRHAAPPTAAGRCARPARKARASCAA